MRAVPPFRYEPPVHSVGDRLELTLAFPDEPTLRVHLDPLGLQEAAELKDRDAELECFGLPLFLTAFGAQIALTIRPHDPHEHLGGEHFAQAEMIASVLQQSGALAFSTTPFHPKATPPAGPVDSSSAERRLRLDEARFRERNATTYTVRIGPRTRIGFETIVLGGPPRSVPRGAPEITPETQCSDGQFGKLLTPADLREGAIARVTPSVGRRADGEFGLIAMRLSLFTPDFAGIARARRMREWLAEYDVSTTTSDEESEALYLQKICEDHTSHHDYEEDAVARMVVARKAISRMYLATRMAIVSAALKILRELHLPCLFDARQLVERGTLDGDALLSFLVGKLDAALAKVGSPRRFVPLFFFATDSLPTYVCITDQERKDLLDRNFASEAPRLDGALAKDVRAAISSLESMAKDGRVEPMLANEMAAALRGCLARPSAPEMALATFYVLAPSTVGRINESAWGIELLRATLTGVQHSAASALESDAGIAYLAKLSDESFVAATKKPNFPAALTGARVIAAAPLDAYRARSHEAVVLVTSDASRTPSGGVMVDGAHFLCVGVAPRFLAAYGDYVVAGVARKHDQSIWPIVIDINSRSSSISDERLQKMGVRFVGINPAVIALEIDGKHVGIPFAQLKWRRLDSAWRPPSIPEPARAPQRAPR